MFLMAKLGSIFGYLSSRVLSSGVDDSRKKLEDLHSAAGVREAGNSAAAGQKVGEYTQWLRDMRDRLDD
jgi:hypothetical protein